MKKIIILVVLILIVLLIPIYMLLNNRGSNDSSLKSDEQRNTLMDSSKAENENLSFYGKIIDANLNSIIVEPNENEEERKSSDKFSISLEENNDMMYEVGTSVKITYTGLIRETYPAQIDATNIEIKSADNFEILFYDKKPQTDSKINTILNKSENDKYDYNIYSYEGSVNIVINGETLSLRNALLDNKITIDEIITKANEDLNNKKITGDTFRDGGSMIYEYDTFTVIKMHTVDGNRDVYIGPKEMSINDII